jgi:hypothetical protein
MGYCLCFPPDVINLLQVTNFDTENHTKDLAAKSPLKLIYSRRYTQLNLSSQLAVSMCRRSQGSTFYFLPSSGRFRIWLHMGYSCRKQFATFSHLLQGTACHGTGREPPIATWEAGRPTYPPYCRAHPLLRVSLISLISLIAHTRLWRVLATY